MSAIRMHEALAALPIGREATPPRSDGEAIVAGMALILLALAEATRTVGVG